MHRPLSPGVRAPGTPWIGGWVGPRAGVDVMANRSPIIAPARYKTSVVQLVYFLLFSLVPLLTVRRAQDRNRWRSPVSTLINPLFPLRQGISLSGERLLASEEGLCFVEVVSPGMYYVI